jgi:2-polyprenyl-6-methoxyphenol hydroxylase-like FAD-dependent oxidoreductase
MTLRIAISGAGIAGPTLAHWLLRCGHVPTLIECAPAFRTGGYVIDFWGVGYEVARRMGLEPAVRNAGYQMRLLRSVGDAGEVRAELRVDGFRELAGGNYTSIPRGDLAALVYATIENRIETIFGDSIAAIEQYDAGVHVTLESGAEREFDLVIGADGLHSRVRELAFGPEQAYARFLGCRVAAFVVEGYRPRDELVYLTHNVPGRQVGRFALRGDRTLFLFLFRSAQAAAIDDPDVQKALLHREFDDAGWECPRILAALDASDDVYFDVVSQIRMPRWSQGRVALVGDAAACVSLLAGEGTGLAMTEACVLAGELARGGGDHRGAFVRYESRLRSFLAAKQAAAPGFIGFFVSRTRLGLWFRDLAVRAMNVGPVFRRLAARTFRDDFQLPDYEFGPPPGAPSAGVNAYHRPRPDG